MPLVGLLSDSHGRAPTTRRAFQMLLDQGARTILHLGDVGTEATIDALVPPTPAAPENEAKVAVHLVFGNTDYEAASLAGYATRVGISVDDPIGCISVGGKTLVFMHGHDAYAMTRELTKTPPPAYLCHGHSHQTRDERRGPTRIINPGALFRAAVHTVALLDTDTDQLRFLQIDVH